MVIENCVDDTCCTLEDVSSVKLTFLKLSGLTPEEGIPKGVAPEVLSKKLTTFKTSSTGFSDTSLPLNPLSSEFNRYITNARLASSRALPPATCADVAVSLFIVKSNVKRETFTNVEGVLFATSTRNSKGSIEIRTLVAVLLFTSKRTTSFKDKEFSLMERIVIGFTPLTTLSIDCQICNGTPEDGLVLAIEFSKS